MRERETERQTDRQTDRQRQTDRNLYGNMVFTTKGFFKVARESWPECVSNL